MSRSPCCVFHDTGGHPEDRCGMDPATIVYERARDPKRPESATEAAARRRAIDIARMITESDGEDACAIRAHLITMGWRAP